MRTSLLEMLGQVQDIGPLINKMMFGPMIYWYSVYQLELLRVTSKTNMLPTLFMYLEDQQIQKDKTGIFLKVNQINKHLYLEPVFSLKHEMKHGTWR